MATNLASYASADEDYIDLELSSSSPPATEFEFQMSFTSNEQETTTSPADELLYKGKLLPLHLPLRLRMVENLQNSTTDAPVTSTFDITGEPFEEDYYYSMPFITFSAASCTNFTNTPLDSCDISPSESCRVSSELNPDDNFFEWSSELSSFIKSHPANKSWSKKLKLIKHTILAQKLKASRAYLKSLFRKSVCSNELCTKADCNAVAANLSKAEAHISRASCPKLATIVKDVEGIEDKVQRRSFSGAIKRRSPIKCLSSSSSNCSSAAPSSSSSSFSFSSNRFYELQFLRSSTSAPEIEVSIDAAIAHCKKSQQIFHLRNSEQGLCSI
ncbi:probable membrane-associated kinase regulator 4 [Sesamum indicum]|uniref:Probable membrane-associated kinase regulator 4 n=1 Tax=Sesamum indicum TaxID=4182 RepID=A0A6I9T1S5_SESIN|nr:probable membrane-associated kinase regulator 4 [Sesamum indicum]